MPQKLAVSRGVQQVQVVALNRWWADGRVDAHVYIYILYVYYMYCIYIYIICMYILYIHIFLHTYSYQLERTFEEHLLVLVEFLGHRNHRGEPDPQQSVLDVGASISLSSEDLRRCRLGRIFGFPNLGFKQRCGISTSRQWVLANRDWDWGNQKKSHLSYQEKEFQPTEKGRFNNIWDVFSQRQWSKTISDEIYF